VPILSTEGSAAFERWTLTGDDQVLPSDGPHSERRNAYRFYSATDYIQAQRARTLLIESMAKIFAQVDVIVTPSFGPQLSITNMTGHPAIILPDGLRGPDAPSPASEADGARDNVGGPGTPVSITFLGALYRDAQLAAFARAYQLAAGHLGLRPKLA
jgi:Asp-tRNA(Asn)/Glu-tRNA(Gln) amidotransferase A subunit family amidase